MIILNVVVSTVGVFMKIYLQVLIHRGLDVTYVHTCFFLKFLLRGEKKLYITTVQFCTNGTFSSHCNIYKHASRTVTHVWKNPDGKVCPSTYLSVYISF